VWVNFNHRDFSHLLGWTRTQLLARIVAWVPHIRSGTGTKVSRAQSGLAGSKGDRLLMPPPGDVDA